jgi:hypothetical protein
MTSTLLELIISGSFKATDGEIESYDGVKCLIPNLAPDKANQMVIKRYAKMFVSRELKADGETPKHKRISKMREVFIDSVDEVESTTPLSYVGKNILEMDAEEIQDFAAANDLAAVPLYKVGSVASARRIAYAEYANNVLGMEPKLQWKETGFNPAQLPPIVATEDVQQSTAHVALVEESIDLEQLILNKQAKPGQTSQLTMDQLKAIAKHKKIEHHPNIGYKALYDRVYGTGKAA